MKKLATRVLVIADDITGAAEMAGIAFAHGLRTQLMVAADGKEAAQEEPDTADVLVVATDTRSMTEAEAVAETHRILTVLAKSDCRDAVVFKKTDSALRGHVVAELRPLLQATGCRQALYMPANPSKGRTISGGVYYIGGRPIAETDFSFDPEFPAKTSRLSERFPDAKDILMPDAESLTDIDRLVAEAPDGTLFAGAADLFTAVLRKQFATQPTTEDNSGVDISQPTLIVCGSTQSKPLDLGIAEAPMPLAIYDGSTDIGLWPTARYADTHSAILTIPHRHRTGKQAAEHLRHATALMVSRLVSIHRPQELIIEGGATAFAILQQLGWQQFRIVQQLAPGVVRMQAPSGTFVTMKPGSYPWASALPTREDGDDC